MLKHLHILNYALIQSLDIDFSDGFSVMTGETGAGKSIILGALGLVMGAKADTKAITEGEERCIIEATFDGDEEIIVRRELHQNGRSRSFVNDEVVSQAELKKLSTRLIDIHSQHENLLLSDDSFQLSIVDSLAANDSLRAQYTEAYTLYRTTEQQLHDLERLAAQSRKDADYIQFQYNQLEEAHLVENELEELEDEQYRLSHADDIRTSLMMATQLLDDGEVNILSLLRSINIEDASPELSERIRSAEIELKDIAREVSREADAIESDPERLAQVDERIDLLNSLLKKHNAKDVNELITLRDTLEKQCERMDSFDEDIAQLKRQLEQAHQAAWQIGLQLRKSREAVCPSMAESLVRDLTSLGIAHAKIQVQVNPLSELQESGMDDVQILFAANLNQSVRRVSEVASGGEISRLMLCIKALIAATNGLPTIIFDEIDTGVSGEVASQMGRIMQSMARSRQIIAITHLPQIAACGSLQYHVYKQDTTDRTVTNIRQLTRDERVEEIAMMLSGKQPSPAAIENAKQLLNSQFVK